MDNWQRSVPYLILAFICGLASFGIVFMAMMTALRTGMTDSAMMAVAGMAFAPAVMGIGIAANMPRDRH
jgi:tellurite resistance protein TehA-like permease